MSIPRGLRCAALLACLTVFFAVVSAPAFAANKTYSATQNIPVPPASSFSGTAGGDGWGVSVSDTRVFNVFHHGTQLVVNCRNQADSSACWSGPRTVQGPGNANFAVSGHSDAEYDFNSGHLYVYAQRSSDNTGGVVCVDTTSSSTNPYCGFTALTPAGESVPAYGWGSLSAPMTVGRRIYSFNFAPNNAVSGSRNKLLCFDMDTAAACAGQPYAVNYGGGTVSATGPSPTTAALGHKLMIPVQTSGGARMGCFDTDTSSDCSGSWPVSVPTTYGGGPIPLMSADGTINGVCTRGYSPCWTLAGDSVSAPAGLTSAITSAASWNGGPVVLGPRVYVPNGNSNSVQCFDYSTGASCAGFPKTIPNLSLLYTVNSDPLRPSCLWVNADNGSAQIQNFDAYTGKACGQGAVRVLASASVVAQQKCVPASYESLQVLTPAPGSYSNGTVTFVDAAGNPIAGAAGRPIGADGTVDLTGLSLNTAAGLPQFLINLPGQSASSVTVRLTWTGLDDADCNPAASPPSAAITSPATGGVYQLNQVVPTSFSCTDGDGGGGIVSCTDSNGAAGSDDTGAGSTGTGLLDTSYGTHTYTVTATSRSGMVRRTSISYSVPRPKGVYIQDGCITVKNGQVQPYVADVAGIDDNVYVFTEAAPSLPDNLVGMYE